MIVVGAGPIGVELGIVAQRAGLSALLLDRGQVGQTIAGFPARMRFFSSNERISLAGSPLQTIDQSKCTREEYLAYLRQLVRTFELPVRAYESVESIKKQGRGFAVLTDRAGNRAVHQAGKVVLATGGTAYPRKLGIPGEELPHVHHRFTEAHDYFQQRLLVIGGKNSAVEAALRCHQAFAQVSLSYRQPALNEQSIKYWLMPEIRGLIKTGEIQAYLGTIPVAIEPEGVRLRQLDSDQEIFVPTDHVLILIGFLADMHLFEQAGVRLQGESRIPEYDPRTMQTNVPGLYVAGTAVAGTQTSYKIFLENCHIHCDRIVAHLTGKSVPVSPQSIELPET